MNHLNSLKNFVTSGAATDSIQQFCTKSYNRVVNNHYVKQSVVKLNDTIAYMNKVGLEVGGKIATHPALAHLVYGATAVSTYLLAHKVSKATYSFVLKTHDGSRQDSSFISKLARVVVIPSAVGAAEYGAILGLGKWTGQVLNNQFTTAYIVGAVAFACYMENNIIRGSEIQAKIQKRFAADLSKENEELKRQLADDKKIIEDLKENLNAATTFLENAKEEKITAEESNRISQEQLGIVQEKLKQNEKSIQSLELELNNKTDSIRALEKDLETAYAEKSKVDEELGKQQEEVKNLEKTLGLANQEKNGALQQLERERAQNQQTVEQLKTHIQELEEKLANKSN